MDMVRRNGAVGAGQETVESVRREEKVQGGKDLWNIGCEPGVEYRRSDG